MITIDLSNVDIDKIIEEIINKNKINYDYVFGREHFLFNEFHLIYKSSNWGIGNRKLVGTDVFLGEYRFSELFYDDQNYSVGWSIKLKNFCDIDENEPKDYDMKVMLDRDYKMMPYPESTTSCTGGNYNRGEYIATCMLYILSQLEKREIKEIQKEKKKKYEIKKKSGGKVNKDVLMLSDIKKYYYIDDSGISGKEINCPCWDVRGHYRHYKNGKVIFIKSYKKGKERDKRQAEDKIYRI